MSKNNEKESNKNVAFSENIENSTKEVSKPIEKKINLSIFLELNPQNYYIEALMRKNYAQGFHTTTQWNEIVEKIKK